MKLFYYGKDGGAESTCWGFWLIEIKSLFSVALLQFVGNSREAYHNHAFNSLSWVLSGGLVEDVMLGPGKGVMRFRRPNVLPIITRRSTFHKVDSVGTTWVLTFRGPWADTWREFLPIPNQFRTLTHGRKEVA